MIMNTMKSYNPKLYNNTAERERERRKEKEGTDRPEQKYHMDTDISINK